MEFKFNSNRLTKVDTENENVTWQNGIDEMNLAEFPLAAISDRINDGIKTVTLEDSIFDRVERRHVTRRIVLSGSDQYGLPTAKDDDVLLACMQVSKQQDFKTPEIQFTRYELLKLLGWSDESKNYARVAQSLRRWKGLTIFSDRAFYDFGQKSWVNRDFGIFDSLYIYRREADLVPSLRAMSRFTWNEVLFKNFQAGYLKQIDWQLYISLKSPIAKRLYRFLDKRFYHGNIVEMELDELAFRKLRLSKNYNSAQIKRVLRIGLEELERVWHLKPLPDSRRFLKQSAGRWTIRFERKPQRLKSYTQRLGTKSIPAMNRSPSTVSPQVHNPVGNLQIALTKRGIGPSAAEEIVAKHASQSIQTMIELFDWYNQHNQPRGAGFLVNAIRAPNAIEFPKQFRSSLHCQEQQNKLASRQKFEERAKSQRQTSNARRDLERRKAFEAFWQRLSPNEQTAFEGNAIDQADDTKRAGYLRYAGKRGKIFDQYRFVILLDHFERSA